MIDDLTIENKRLRQLLRDRRQQHHPQLDRDKIFEVRACDLSTEKKRELETILQKFASTMGDVSSGARETSVDESAPRRSSRALPELTIQKVASYPNTDSAYASISNSGRTSAGQSNETREESQRMRGSKTRTQSSNVKSYLHDIPDSLLPNQPPIMSEKSKMRLVVKRLEQLFTGKNATPGEHSQPLQQQKVSESAASADKQDYQQFPRYLRPEGAREAHIIPIGSKVDLDSTKDNSWYKPSVGSKSESEKSCDGRSGSGIRSPDQRPTRPLDLDIHRAQVAEENMEYIRHLGLPTPERQHDAENPDDGWLYLNLLINMAQLHTINVTPAFVRKSVADISTKFELSKDARKIRWKGDCDGVGSSDNADSTTEVITESSPDLTHRLTTDKSTKDSTSSANVASTISSRHRLAKTFQSLSSEQNPCTHCTEPSLRPSNVTDNSRSVSTFDYKPLFIKDRATTQDNASYDDLDFLGSTHGVEEANGQGLDAQANSINHNCWGRPENDGPIIYYKNPLFYCDMSSNKQAHLSNVATVPSTLEHLLGLPISELWMDDERLEPRLIDAEEAFNSFVKDDDLPFLELAPLTDVIDYQRDLVEFSASGVGGVLPDDHFTLRVQRKQYRTHLEKVRSAAIGSKGMRCFMREQITSTIRIDLPASTLPPPSYVFLSLSSGSSGDCESGESYSYSADDSEADVVDDAPLAPPGLRRFPIDSLGKVRAADEDPHEVDAYNQASGQDLPDDEALDSDEEEKVNSI